MKGVLKPKENSEHGVILDNSNWKHVEPSEIAVWDRKQTLKAYSKGEM
jgi:hypothetical protein